LSPSPLCVAVFASGGGSNFQALLDHAGADGSSRRGAPWRPVLLVSDRDGAGALDRARAAGVERAIVPTTGRDAAEVAAEMLELLDAHHVDALLLAGYLKLVPTDVVRRYRGRIVNIHPALLPAFGGPGMYGMNVHRAVLESGARVTGATVHLVDEVYDRGPIVAQWPVPVRPGDTGEDLAARVLAVEHRLYPRTVDHLCAAWLQDREPGPLVERGDAFRLVDARAGSDTSEPEREAS
jgi:formyltetrahydrofolate-dependent phosphoribosylglycinamide formyltransferase